MTKTRVLLVEDNPGDVTLTQRLVHSASPGQFELVPVGRLDGAIQLLRNEAFDVVLLDLGLPDSRTLEALHCILEQAPSLPIVVLTGHDDEDLALHAVREGAQSYLLKGSTDGRFLVFTLRSAMLRKETELELARKAFYDELTGLPTRTLLYDRWDRARKRQMRSESWMGVLVIDLNDFKQINDSYGHLAGDVVLQTVAQRCEETLRQGDTIGRFGGDEFVVLLENVRGIEDVTKVSDKLAGRIAEPIEVEGDSLLASASIGIAITHPENPDSLADMIRRADLDMYNRKKAKYSPEGRLDRRLAEGRQRLQA